jgi:hypothetical protein
MPLYSMLQEKHGIIVQFLKTSVHARLVVSSEKAESISVFSSVEKGAFCL